MNIYFKGIRVLNPGQNLDFIGNLWLKNGIIEHCDKLEAQVDSNTEIIQAENMVAAPGFFDMHVHLREPGYEYKESIHSGATSAANGGFTGVCCMPNTEPTIDNAAVVELIKQKSKGLLTDVEIAASITVNRDGNQLSPMLELRDCGVVLFTDDGSATMNSQVMRRAFDYSTNKDLLIAQHCEDHSLTEGFSANESKNSTKLGLKGFPSVAEEIILSRDIMLAEYCGNRRYHCSHISTKNAVRIVKDAKSRGLRVTCEVTPHHFILTEDYIQQYDTNFKMNPPLRTKEDVDAMKLALADGTIDCIATDHAPHALHEKEVEFERAPNGIIGLETALGLCLTYLVHSNILTLSQLIEKMSINPRRILQLPEIKIEKNVQANLTIFAPDEEWVINKDLFRSKSRNMPFNNYKLKGKPKYSVNNNIIHQTIL